MEQETERTQFNKHTNTCIQSLNALLQSTVVCKNERIMLRTNRFKKWLLKTQNAINEAE